MLYDPKWSEAQELLDLNKPSLEALSYILRHKGLWPPEFYWDYSQCDRCAMGLAASLWKLTTANGFELGYLTSPDFMSDNFQVPDGVTRSVFMGRGQWVPQTKGGDCNWQAVTPEMVADQIDQYLATK